MEWTLSPLAFWTFVAAGVVGMEVLAWAGHKYVLHGPAWSLHRSHHEGTTSGLEANDAVAVVLAAVAMALFVVGDWTMGLATASALSMTLYGFLYAVVHEGLAHGRIRLPRTLMRGYIKRLVQAHRFHHASLTREGAVAHGFLYAPPVRILREKVRECKAGSRLQET